MGVRLLAVTLAPTLQGELDPESGALDGTLGVLEELGAQSLHRFVAGLVRQLRTGEQIPRAAHQAARHRRRVAALP